MSFGYYRSEVLGALFSTLIIWVLTGVLVYLAILRCIDQSFEIEKTAMVTTASMGVVFNIIMYFILHTGEFYNSLIAKNKIKQYSSSFRPMLQGNRVESSWSFSFWGWSWSRS